MTEPITGKSVIALFPDACQLTPDSDYLSSGYHDVPWEEPALVKELARSPHSIRRVLSWLKGRLSR
jgi:hypothetical protein